MQAAIQEKMGGCPTKDSALLACCADPASTDVSVAGASEECGQLFSFAFAAELRGSSKKDRSLAACQADGAAGVAADEISKECKARRVGRATGAASSARACVCASVWVALCLHACMPACLRACAPACLRACVPAFWRPSRWASRRGARHSTDPLLRPWRPWRLWLPAPTRAVRVHIRDAQVFIVSQLGECPGACP